MSIAKLLLNTALFFNAQEANPLLLTKPESVDISSINGATKENVFIDRAGTKELYLYKVKNFNITDLDKRDEKDSKDPDLKPSRIKFDGVLESGSRFNFTLNETDINKLTIVLSEQSSPISVFDLGRYNKLKNINIVSNTNDPNRPKTDVINFLSTPENCTLNFNSDYKDRFNLPDEFIGKIKLETEKPPRIKLSGVDIFGRETKNKDLSYSFDFENRYFFRGFDPNLESFGDLFYNNPDSPLSAKVVQHSSFEVDQPWVRRVLFNNPDSTFAIEVAKSGKLDIGSELAVALINNHPSSRFTRTYLAQSDFDPNNSDIIDFLKRDIYPVFSEKIIRHPEFDNRASWIIELLDENPKHRLRDIYRR